MIVLLVLILMTMTMTMAVCMVSVIVRGFLVMRVLGGLIGHHVGKYWVRYHLIDEFSITIWPRRELLVSKYNFHDRTV
jgi:hypothetical protein